LLVLDELADGRLVRILSEFEVKSHDIFWAYPSVRFMRPAVRAFTDFVVPALRAVEGIDISDQPNAADRVQRGDSRHVPSKPNGKLDNGHRQAGIGKTPRPMHRPRSEPSE
jgi:hypothetical protein